MSSPALAVKEDYARSIIYERLFVEFGEVAYALGGWASIEGTILEGKIEAIAERLRKESQDLRAVAERVLEQDKSLSEGGAVKWDELVTAARSALGR